MRLLFSPYGRAGIKEFWIAHLILYALLFAAIFGLVFLMAGTGLVEPATTADAGPDFAQLIQDPMFLGIMGLVIITYISSAMISTRRLHDRGKSGWWFLLMLLLSTVLIGSIWWLIELGFLEGTEGPNAYGDAQAWKKS